MSLSKTQEAKLLYNRTNVTSSFNTEQVRKVNMGSYQVQVDFTNLTNILATVKLQMRVSNQSEWVDVTASQITLDTDEDENIVYDVNLKAGFFRLSVQIVTGSMDVVSYYNVTERYM
jgi:hypothetical protein